MPSSGRNRARGSRTQGARPRNTARAGPSSSRYIGDIDGTDIWDDILRLTCAYFNIPDLWSRHGLKKVHADFDNIHERLEEAYQSNPEHEKVVGAIVSVYAKMSEDAILRDKIFHRGFMQRLLPLFEMDSCRHLALHALNVFTHHGGNGVRAEIAKQSAPTLVRLIDRYPDDPVVADRAITTLCYSVTPVIGTWNPTLQTRVLYATLICLVSFGSSPTHLKNLQPPAMSYFMPLS
ncbi:hypothetical protein HGRIS_000358 [Hohenbuehelia grisea]|uniref:Uncharacterized protein n=1 Tax=Hohenbuehelia grisea TaxID=104357 RepID=A0ABR3JSP6_9AGAR